MLICVISDLELGSLRASAIAVVKTAGGFARLGHDVVVLCRPPAGGLDPATAARRYAETALRFRFAPPGVEGISDPDEAFGVWASRTAASIRPDLVYARTYWAPLICAERGMRTALEVDAPARDRSPLLLACLRAAVGPPVSTLRILAPTTGRRAEYIQRGASPAWTHVVPGGVDLELFSPRPGPESPYSGPGPHIVYAGGLEERKGLSTILDAAKALTRWRFHLVGGDDQTFPVAKERVRKMRLGNVSLHGQISHEDLPPYLWNADVLVLPPPWDEAGDERAGTPKVGEYLASGRPIVAGDSPALREQLGDEAPRWYTPRRADELVEALKSAMDAPADDRRARSEAARTRAGTLSYTRRVETILRVSGLGGAMPMSA